MKTSEPKKLKISAGRFVKRLFITALIIYVVVNPLGAANSVHDIAYWIGSWFA